MQELYTAEVTVHGGREGNAHSSDGILNLNLGLPKEMGGKGKATNPEQLFAAGYAACFESAMRLAAKHAGKPIKNSSITARVTLSKSEDEKFSLGVELYGEIEDSPLHETLALMQAAHQICPYSHATRNNVSVKLIAN